MPLNVEALKEVGRIFDWRPDPARYFASAAAEEVRRGLQNSLATGHGVLVLAGETGAGKTLLAGMVVQALPAHWAHIAQLSFTVMSGQEITSAIAYAFGMPQGPSVMSHQSPQAWIETQLSIWTRCDEASLLVVDEAQNLPPDALLTLLALSQLRLNARPLLRVLLVGQPDFLKWLDTPAWATDLGPRFWVPELTPAESEAYLQHRFAQYAGPALPTLTASALAEIHARTLGRPGRIHMLCQHLLHSAILLETYTPIDAAAVAIQADGLQYPAAPGSVPVPGPVAPNVPMVAMALPSAATGATRRQPTRGARFAGWSTGLAATALVATAGWWYAHRGAEPRAVPDAPLIATESPDTPDPQTQALLSAPPAAPTPAPTVLPATPPAASLPKDPPHVQPLKTHPPAAPAPTRSNAKTATQPPSPAGAPTAAPVVAPKPNARCTNLLTQMSLGEPITARQRHDLATQCR